MALGKGKNSCVIPGCENKIRYGHCSFNSNGTKLKFFALPSVIAHQGERTKRISELRRSKWFEIIYSDPTEINDHAKDGKVCSDHFETGKPAGLYECNKKDWVPSIVINGKMIDSNVMTLNTELKEQLRELGLYPFKDTSKIVNNQKVDVEHKTKYIEKMVYQFKPTTRGCGISQSNLAAPQVSSISRIVQKVSTVSDSIGLDEPKSENSEDINQNCAVEDEVLTMSNLEHDQAETEITPTRLCFANEAETITAHLQDYETVSETNVSQSDEVPHLTILKPITLPQSLVAPTNCSTIDTQKDAYIETLSSRIKYLQSERDSIYNTLTKRIETLEDDKNQITNQMKALQDELSVRNEEVYELRNALSRTILNEGFLEGDNAKTYFYTGIPTYEAFLELYDVIKDSLKSLKMSLTPFQQLMMTCMKMQLNVPQRDLGYRFGISTSTVSRVFGQCLDILHQKFIPPECDMSNLDDPNIDSDDDSPPVEEDFQNAKSYALQQQQAIAKKARDEKQQLKDKRKEIHERNATQKEIKLAKIKKLGSKKLPATFLEKVATFMVKKQENISINRGKKRKVQEEFDNEAEDSNQSCDDNLKDTVERQEASYQDEKDSGGEAENFYSIHGSTKFEVVPIENATQKSTVGNSALEFKMRRINGSNVRRESVSEMLSKQKKQSIKLQYN